MQNGHVRRAENARGRLEARKYVVRHPLGEDEGGLTALHAATTLYASTCVFRLDTYGQANSKVWSTLHRYVIDHEESSGCVRGSKGTDHYNTAITCIPGIEEPGLVVSLPIGVE